MRGVSKFKYKYRCGDSYFTRQISLAHLYDCLAGYFLTHSTRHFMFISLRWAQKSSYGCTPSSIAQTRDQNTGCCTLFLLNRNMGFVCS